MIKILTAGSRAAVVGAVALVLTIGPASAQELSEKSVRAFMDYAWSLTPAKFTKPDGVSILIDKNDRSKIEIPMDVAREVIKVGRLSAHAQMCELLEDQINNYRSLMKREDIKGKWTDQQMIFINQLHLTTVMLLMGKIKVVEQAEGGKQAVVEDGKPAEAMTCTDEQRKKVKELITAYVKSGPPLTQAAAPAPAAPATAAQAPGPTKK